LFDLLVEDPLIAKKLACRTQAFQLLQDMLPHNAILHELMQLCSRPRHESRGQLP
jgi:hypothetical protein